jgi:DNA-binding IclR family transcriptional regulator
MIEKKSSGSVAHAANILLCLSEQVHTISEISRQCQLGKSTVHRVLKLLEQTGMVIQDPINRNYYLGPFISRLNANPGTSHEYLIILALDEMRRLSRLAGETIPLDLMIGLKLMPLYELTSLHDLKVTQQSKIEGPSHAGASRKVLLSQLDDRQLKMVLAGLEYTKLTERTVTSPEVLMAQIKEIRKQGYAVSYGEVNPGVICLSAPVLHYVFPAAVSIIGPEVRIHSRVKEFIEELRVSAARISQKLAGNQEKEGV